jgi:hypothetical protein
MAANKNIRNLIATAAVLGAMTLPAAALDISKHAKDSAEVNVVLLKGTVTDGDAYELKTYLKTLPKKATTVVYLDSPGGNLREGLKLGNLFYEFKIETVVDDKASCTSACALAFLGGRDINEKAKRTKVSTGRLGFHSFSRDFNDKVTYSAGDLKIVLQRTQTEVFNIAEYLRGIETNMDVLRIMLGAPSSAMNFVSNDDAIELGIAVWDSKTGKPVDPAPVLERLAKVRADAKIAASLPQAPAAPAPVTAGSDGGASPVKPTAAVVPPASPKGPATATPSAKSDSAGRAG